MSLKVQKKRDETADESNEIQPVIKRRMKEIEIFYNQCQKQRQYNLDETGNLHPQCIFSNSEVDLAIEKFHLRVPSLIRRHTLRHPIFHSSASSLSHDNLTLTPGKIDAMPFVGYKR
ncbi:unnamed protein product [Diamesa serratosioi]